MLPSITRKAHAKINLTLEVTGRRADNLHEIASVMQTIELHDIVTVSDSDSDIVEITDTTYLPQISEQNTVATAVQVMKQRTGIKKCVKIVLDKRIPISSGLGGGSSDAAAILNCLNLLWELKLTKSELAQIAFEIGSDVPFFIYGGTALVTGAGENVSSIVAIPQQDIGLLVWRAKIEKKTTRAYAKLVPSDWTDGMRTHKMVKIIENTQQVRDSDTYNVFNTVIGELLPDWRKYHIVLQKDTNLKMNLTGAGPTTFTLTKPLEYANNLKRSSMRDKFDFVVTKTVG